MHLPTLPPPTRLRSTATIFFLLASLAIAAAAGAATPKVSLNGSQPRPFYLFAHNPNTIQQVNDAVAAGANALEPDVSSYDDCPNASPDQPLVIAHGVDCSELDKTGHAHTYPTVTDYLGQLNAVAQANPALALVVFDDKSSAAKPWRGPELRHAVLHALNVSGVQLNVIYSVASRSDAGFFDQIIDVIGDREGVMIDQEDDVEVISDWFIARGLDTTFGYGDGTSQLGPNLPRAIAKASFWRASHGYPSTIPYVYTVKYSGDMNYFINEGVDGIIPDSYGLFGMPHPMNLGVFARLVDQVSQHPEIRPATRADDPFAPALEAYGLELRTGSYNEGGTDANLTLTLTGCKGSATIVVDAGQVRAGYDSGRFVAGGWDYVTIPSTDLGQLASITVANDGSGYRPSWDLAEIHVSSARWIGRNEHHTVEYTAKPMTTIGANKKKTITLLPNFQEPAPSIACPADFAVPNQPGQCGAWASYQPATTSMCGDEQPIGLPPSGSWFPVGTQTVLAKASSPSTGDSPYCSFQVTVWDVEPPTVGCPPDLAIDATSPAGAPLTYNTWSKDNCPGVSDPACNLPSGSLFPQQDSQVICQATDAYGKLEGQCTFKVHVRTAGEQITRLQGKLLDGAGAPTPLWFELQGVLDLLTDTAHPHTTADVCAAMAAFIADLAKNQPGYPPAVLADLIAAAKRISDVLGCAPPATHPL